MGDIAVTPRKQPPLLKLTPEQQPPVPAARHGRFCSMVSNKPLTKLLAERYGRPRLCLKILHITGDIWEGAPLVSVTQTQNLAAARGIAPRVYDIVRLQDGTLAQATDWAPPGVEPSLRGIERLVQFLRQSEVATAKLVGPAGPPKWDIVTSNSNWSGDLFLDWGGLYLKYPEQYLSGLVARTSVGITGAECGKPVDVTYQPLPELGLNGQRDAQHRIDVMQLDRLDWRGKTVLDLGCNLGGFCFYAEQRGARRVVGVDRPMLAEPMREVANWLGHWNVDFVGAELAEQAEPIRGAAGIKCFDVVFALSLCNHIGGYASWIADLCADILILEGHGGDDPARYLASLQADFASVNVIGFTTDRMRRPIFVCRK